MKSEKLKMPLREIKIARVLIIAIYKRIKEEHPKLRAIDSNIFHWLIFEINKKCKLGLSYSYFHHGAYVQAVDDALVEMNLMDKKCHQFNGTDTRIMFPLILCDCHRNQKITTPLAPCVLNYI